MPEESKKDRFIQAVEKMTEAIPIPPLYKPMIMPLMGQLMTSLHQLTDSDVEDMIIKFKEQISYVEFGDY